MCVNKDKFIPIPYESRFSMQVFFRMLESFINGEYPASLKTVLLDNAYNFRVLIGTSILGYKSSYHAREIAAIKLPSGLLVNRSSHISWLLLIK